MMSQAYLQINVEEQAITEGSIVERPHLKMRSCHKHKGVF
ncbi:hypothetical protein BN18_1105 [Klebsiella pneumoniae subsp. pneumoniae ST512-K30BO]|nr:hypothetical protein UKKV901664_42630 [Klebsiella pneumoniae subsp. pneumoniae UKKV901664]CCM92823.1 hypothetical protein BN18_1105 [Klebsiella pneumoniae subsp. pneumoniae ST512-K30BO]